MTGRVKQLLWRAVAGIGEVAHAALFGGLIVGLWVTSTTWLDLRNLDKSLQEVSVDLVQGASITRELSIPYYGQFKLLLKADWGYESAEWEEKERFALLHPLYVQFSLQRGGDLVFEGSLDELQIGAGIFGVRGEVLGGMEGGRGPDFVVHFAVVEAAPQWIEHKGILRIAARRGGKEGMGVQLAMYLGIAVTLVFSVVLITIALVKRSYRRYLQTPLDADEVPE